MTNSNIDPSIFKAYDIRGVYPGQINGDLVYKIVRAYVNLIGPKNVAVGHDMRLSGEEFKEAAAKALQDAGVNVVDLGLISTDQMYFGVVHLGLDGGVMATASHNPKEFGGLKLVREKAAPVSGDTGIYEIRDMVLGDLNLEVAAKAGEKVQKQIHEEYFKHVLKPFDVKSFKNFKIVANANFGMACPAVKKLKEILPVEFVKVLNGEIDGNFPKGPSDPMLVSNRGETIQAIRDLKPDLGVSWDGDADRCFFFDENGEFVTPAYINALLSKYYLQKYPGGKILHDTRVVRVIDYAIKQGGGQIIMNRAGHSFIKERMIREDIVFGTETSGHYFFKENFYLDNGLLPFLAVMDIISRENKTFSEILKPYRDKFYISEEVNFEFNNPNILEEIKTHYSDAQIDNVDGFDFNYPSWRFNLRSSNTQNLIRLNVEADSAGELKSKLRELTDLISSIK